MRRLTASRRKREDVRVARDGHRLEGQERRCRHDDHPRGPPEAAPERPALGERQRPTSRQQGDDEGPEAAAGRGTDEQVSELEGPRVGVVPQVHRNPQQVVPGAPACIQDEDDDRQHEPEAALDELVRDDDREPAFASHPADSILSGMGSHGAAGLAVVTLALASAACAQPQPSSSTPTLLGHPVRLDATGAILPWPHGPAPYAEVAGLAWTALETKFPVQDNGLPTYLAYSRFDPADFSGVGWPHNPAGLYAMLTDSAVLWYGFSGDDAAVDVARHALDHQLAHGTTPAGWSWASVPYASSSPGDVDYGGADDEWCNFCGRGDGVGVIEPDKVGELGFAYLQFFELTGDTRYRDAAIDCAEALAKHVREGDEARSPWPFRVFAQTDVVREEYSANVVGAMALFDELGRLGLGDTTAYATARATAFAWLMRVPMQNDAWSGYFEDIEPADDPAANPNQYAAMRVARWLVEHPEEDPRWREDVAHLLAWVVDTFGGDTATERGTQYGATVLSEQASDMAKMGSHTARFGATLALWAEATGDASARERAARSLAWATYACDPSGVVAVGEDAREGWWFSDGYGDYIRHFLVAMGARAGLGPAQRGPSAAVDVGGHARGVLTGPRGVDDVRRRLRRDAPARRDALGHHRGRAAARATRRSRRRGLRAARRGIWSSAPSSACATGHRGEVVIASGDPPAAPPLEPTCPGRRGSRRMLGHACRWKPRRTAVGGDGPAGPPGRTSSSPIDPGRERQGTRAEEKGLPQKESGGWAR